VTNAPDVQIPSRAVSDEGDLRQPVRALLEDLNLLGNREEDQEADGFHAAFAGPPQSVALIEAGATAASKWWAAGLGTTAVATWGSVAAWWGSQETAIKVAVVGGAAIVTAALAIAIGYLIASDVRGRAAAAVSLIEARANLATTMIRAAETVYKPAPAESAVKIVPLPGQLRVRNLGRPADDEKGWLAVAMEHHPDGTINYIVVKGSSEARVPASGLAFES
jgi:hypothetical protein